MASHKRAALKRQREAFAAEFDDMGDVFAHEEHRRATMDREREEALRHKACASKNRYATRAEAEGAIASCADWGKTGLTCYRCSYCKGWHLTSHPHR